MTMVYCDTRERLEKEDRKQLGDENDALSDGALVARAATTAAPLKSAALADVGAHCAPNAKPSVESLAASFGDLQLTKDATNKTASVKSVAAPSTRRSDAAISPADFVNLQSMRSSALARKTNTTSKFSRDCRNLFADLLSPTASAAADGAVDTVAEKKSSNAGDAIKSTNTTEKAGTIKDEKVNETKEGDLTEAEKASASAKEEKVVRKISVEANTAVAEQKGVENEEKTESHKSATEKKVEGRERDEKDEDEKFLLSRGPVRASRAHENYHPYESSRGGDGGGAMYGTAAQSAVYDPTSFSTNAYSYGYDCGASQYGSGGRVGGGGIPPQYTYNTAPHCYKTPMMAYSGACATEGNISSRESTPDTVNSELGCGSVYGGAPPYYGMPPMTDAATINGGSKRKIVDHFERHTTLPLSKEKTDEQELPDALSDFILQYSRRYAPDGGSQGASPQSMSTSAESSPFVSYGHDFDGLSAPNSNRSESVCASPLSAVSAPKCSPAQPHGAVSMSGVEQQHAALVQRSIVTNASGGGAGGGNGGGGVNRPAVRKAKERLRALINNDDMDEAWAWTCKCIQNYPGALCYQDGDRDTLLHIVTLHSDLAKIYALVEQMLKLESEICGGEDGGGTTRRQKPFDMANRAGETPLFFAVEKRDYAVVDYLLEAGAQPNAQSLRAERDTPLHYAAARGMDKIVELLCANSQTDVNLTNGIGVTPLLYAVRNHGVLDEDAQLAINSVTTVQILLRKGADATITDSTNGKTVFHYAVERLSDELITIFRAHLSDGDATALVNQADHGRETPLARLAASRNVDDATRQRIHSALVECGAAQNLR